LESDILFGDWNVSPQYFIFPSQFSIRAACGSLQPLFYVEKFDKKV